MSCIKEIRPQPGPQEDALASKSKITIYGGARGGGKTWNQVVNPTRAVHIPGFSAIIFRKKIPEIGVGEQGSLWAEASSIYRNLGGHPNQQLRVFKFETGAKTNHATIKFDHLEQDKHVENHRGKAYAYIGFEEFTNFSPHQFYSLVACNRLGPGCIGVKPWIFATCNPDPDSFVFDLVAPYLDDALYPHPDHINKEKYFVLEGDNYEPHFVDSPDAKGSDGQPAKSINFVPALLTDNRVLMGRDPEYYNELMSLPKYMRDAQLGGCWGVRRGVSIFEGVIPRYVEASEIPSDLKQIRAWDRGSRRKAVGTDPDMTAGAKGGHRIGTDGVREFWITDLVFFQGNPADCVREIKNTADRDGWDVPIYLEEETGSSGKDAIHFYKTILQGFDVRSERPSGDKGSRASGWITDGNNGRLVIVRGNWNRALLDSMQAFPAGKRDLIDCSSLLHSAALQHPWTTKGGIIYGRSRVGKMRDF